MDETSRSSDYLARLRALCDAATEGPWCERYLPQHRYRIIADKDRASICDIALWNVDYSEQQTNAALIAESRTAIPYLLDRPPRLPERRVRRGGGVMRIIDWRSHYRITSGPPAPRHVRVWWWLQQNWPVGVLGGMYGLLVSLVIHAG